jgi:hypothetical protein
VLALLGLSMVLVRPASGEAQLGGFVAAASAQAVRVTFEADGFLIVRSLVDSGGPVSQAVVNSIDGQSFASLPYPGETPLSGPGLIAANGGPTLPSYPFYVSATSNNPEQKFSDPSGAYTLAATVADGQATGDAKLGAGGQDAIATSGRTVAAAGVVADTVTAKGETTVEGITLGGGALRVASVRSRSVTTYSAGAAKPETLTSLIVEGGQAGGTSFAYGPEGLTVASAGMPLPAKQGIEAINKALEPAGISIRFVGTGDVPGGRSADALEVAQTGTLPTGGHGIVRLRFGGATTGITVGGSDTALVPPSPEPSVEPVTPESGPVSETVEPLNPISMPLGGGGAPTATVGDVATEAYEPATRSDARSFARGEAPGASVVTAAAPAVRGEVIAAEAFQLRESASVGVGYGILIAAAVALFVVASIWRRGFLTL